MLRMKKAGYGQHYRKNTLQRTLGIYDNMKEDEEQGERPLNRPRRWKKDERVMAKKKKVQNWSRKGGFIAPIFVPATPQGELAKLLRDMAETESEAGFKFKIVENGGRTIKSHFQKSNPTSSPGCDNDDCLACQDGRGKGGSCLRSNVQYELSCNQCPEDDKCIYIGETSRNLYTRAKEHIGKYRSQSKNSE